MDGTFETETYEEHVRLQLLQSLDDHALGPVEGEVAADR